MLEVDRGANGFVGVAGGNTPERPEGLPAMKPPYKQRYEDHLADARAGRAADPVALCFPPGMPRMMSMIYGMEILQTPKAIAITSEFQAETRRIWMDLKAHPPAEDLDDSYAGHSIGRWVGDVLVVDTVGVRPDVAMDASGLPHGPRMRIVERFRQTAPGVLEDAITVHDPDVFVAPWRSTRTYHYRPDLRLQEYSCLDNNRNIDAQGLPVFAK
jgi:hypothetical protein